MKNLKPVMIFLMALFSLALKQNQTSAPTDPQIAQILIAANNQAIDDAKMAIAKTKDKAIKEFAQMMISNHHFLNNQTTELMSRLRLKPEEGETSKMLSTSGGDAQMNLKYLNGKEFDRDFMDHEVDFHQLILDTIDKILIPNAKRPEVKDFLEKARTMIATHLEQAHRIQRQGWLSQRGPARVAQAYEFKINLR